MRNNRFSPRITLRFCFV